jgi:hypothetical protein
MNTETLRTNPLRLSKSTQKIPNHKQTNILPTPPSPKEPPQQTAWIEKGPKN